jgi:hypothetical protein
MLPPGWTAEEIARLSVGTSTAQPIA